MPTANAQYTDKPWIYVYDGDGLTDGHSYTNLFVNILNDSDFILRRITGFQGLLPLAEGISSVSQMPAILLKRYGVSLTSLALSGGSLYDWPVVPEILFQASSQIVFDLSNVTRFVPIPGTVGTPSYAAQLVFQGVRRFYTPPPPTPPPYRERNFYYTGNVNVTTAGRISPTYTAQSPKFTLIVPMTELSDFELRAITISFAPGVGAYPPTTPPGFQFKMMLFDYTQQPTFSAPVAASYINWADFDYVSCFPIPSLVYPSKSQIQVDVYSLLSNTSTLPMPVSFTFIGVLRDPV